MIEAVKDFLVPKRFGIVAYVCVIVHFLCGLVFTAVTAALRSSENGKFSCSVGAKSTATYKKEVDQSCFARYDQTFNSPLPLYGFVLLSIGIPVLVSVIYSLIVRIRVDEIESSNGRQNAAEDESAGQNSRTVYVFYFYFVHLILRALFGITSTVLQHMYFYPNGFDFKFVCNLSPMPRDQVKTTKSTGKNISRNLKGSTVSSVNCENATASEKRSWSICVSVINIIVAIFILVEVIYLLRRLPILKPRSGSAYSNDYEFVIKHLLRKPYINLLNPPDRELARNETSEHFMMDDNIENSTTRDPIRFYKHEVLNRRRCPHINYLQKCTLDDMYIDVVIHTERAKRPFSEKLLARHEIYDVYTEIPSNSIRLEEIKDLFSPNKDTKGKFPRSILAIGRPGIGKTVLTEKIIRDWAKGIDDFYCDKVAFFFKFRWLNFDELKNISLKKFLHFGTRNLSEEYFEQIYKEIENQPKKAILIFDGLDEFRGDTLNCLEQSRNTPNDLNSGMAAINLCIKLILGDLLKGATVLVTSRPTAEDFYSKLDFDRNVEIIGFTREKIEEYVKKFCENNKTSEIAPQIWNHIQSSSELSNLCYIPVNCLIVCVTLSDCLINLRSTFPTTLTELYQTAINYYEKYHQRINDGDPIKKETLSKLQYMAFHGIDNDQLVFDEESFDEQIRNSGLVNSLSNPIFPLKTQFCFIHLTMQEFLTAKHATEAFAPAELKTFISDHVRSGKWHLVLQFIAGLLGKRIKMEKEYKECLLAFAESIYVHDGKIGVEEKTHNGFVMKCLREVDSEDIVKDVFETTEKSSEVYLFTDDSLSPDECAAITFSVQMMKNVVNVFCFNLTKPLFEEVLKFLQRRCVNSLYLHWSEQDDEQERIWDTQLLGTTVCTIKHKHSKLTTLELTNVDLSSLFKDLETGNLNQLKSLRLRECWTSSHQIKILCDIFNNGHCTELRELALSICPDKGIYIADEGASVLFETLIDGLRGLTSMLMPICYFTDKCIPSLCKALQDERCQLTDLDLGSNAIGNEGARELFENGLTNKHCNLTKLSLMLCSLTLECIHSLCKALQDERCQLTDLDLGFNAIGDEGARELFENGLTNKHCNLTKLSLVYCSLTHECIPSLCKALQDERCQLNHLDLTHNTIGDKGARELFENVLTNKHCKLTKLNLVNCSLTHECIHSLCKALQDERCQLNDLDLGENAIGDEGARELFENGLTNKHCKLTKLSLRKCSLTRECIHSLYKALQKERCQLTYLRLYEPDEGAPKLFESGQTNEHCSTE